MLAYLDGRWIEESDASIPIRDRGFLFADGVFETALLFRGRYFHLDHHLHRLAASAGIMGIAAPPVAVMREIAGEIARRNSLDEGSLRITLTAGARAGELGTILVTISPRDSAWIERAHIGWNIITAATRRPSTAAVPAQLKALGRTYALLAKREAMDARADDALLLTDDGSVCEGPSWNVFWRTGDVLYTPTLDIGVLAGITRGMMITIAADLGFRAHEGAFPRTALDDADEIFATMTSVGIARIRSLDGVMLPIETPAADVLYAKYWDAVQRYCEGHGE